MLKSAILAGALLCALSINAEARQRHRVMSACIETGTNLQPSCMGNDFLAGVKSIRVQMKRERHLTNPRPRQARQSAIVAHPIGCPWRAFCGCGAVERLKHAWGVIVKKPRELWLAANWFRFPRSAPAPGMVAVRRHHVFVLEQHLGGDKWLAFDANSGGHRTRIHARSIEGYTIVNPRA